MSRRRVGKTLKKTSLTINKELIDWIEDLVQKGEFINKSHGVSFAIEYLKKQYDKVGSLQKLPS